jgi:ligand-binding sensor domain-containing protein
VVLKSQSIAFRNISVKDGLNSNLVYKVSLDNEGLLWIVSNQGLSSYNGNQVKNYTDKEIEGIENFAFREILIDRYNTIWLKDLDGIVHYLDSCRYLKQIQVDSSSLKILNLIKTQDNEVEFLGRQGHYKFNSNHSRLDTIHHFSESISNSFAHQISTEDDGLYLITFPGRLKLYNSKTGKVDFNFRLYSSIGSVMLNKNQILASTGRFNQLFIIDIEKNEIVKNLSDKIKNDIPYSNTYFRYMKHISDELIGISSGYLGLFILNKKDFSVRNYHHQIANTRSISSDNTYHIYVHDEGNVFVTSRTTGINYFNLNRRDAEHINTFFDSETDQIFDGHIGQICTDNEDNIWIGSSKGLMKYDALRQ